MRLAITVLGRDLLTLEITTTTTEQQADGPGDCTSYPVGFTASPGDQRWDRGAELT